MTYLNIVTYQIMWYCTWFGFGNVRLDIGGQLSVHVRLAIGGKSSGRQFQVLLLTYFKDIYLFSRSLITKKINAQLMKWCRPTTSRMRWQMLHVFSTISQSCCDCQRRSVNYHTIYWSVVIRDWLMSSMTTWLHADGMRDKSEVEDAFIRHDTRLLQTKPSRKRCFKYVWLSEWFSN